VYRSADKIAAAHSRESLAGDSPGTKSVGLGIATGEWGKSQAAFLVVLYMILRCGNGLVHRLKNSKTAEERQKSRAALKFYANLSDIREIEIVRSQH
jgi:hypothetical protein